jgi:hypothetical protein
VVGRDGDALDHLEAQDPSVEVLTAHGIEDALGNWPQPPD